MLNMLVKWPTVIVELGLQVLKNMNMNPLCEVFEYMVKFMYGIVGIYL